MLVHTVQSQQRQLAETWLPDKGLGLLFGRMFAKRVQSPVQIKKKKKNPKTLADVLEAHSMLPAAGTWC